MVSQGRRFDWEDVAELEGGGTGGGDRDHEEGRDEKQKKSNKNPWNSDSEAEKCEKSGLEESSVEEACKTAGKVAVDIVLAKASEDGGLISEFVKKVAVMEEEAREKMLEHYSKTQPQGLSLAKKEMGLVSMKWMVEKRMEKNEEMTEEGMMGEGKERPTFQEWNGLVDTFDLGKHAGEDISESMFDKTGYCDWTVRQGKPVMWKVKCSKYFVRRNERP